MAQEIELKLAFLPVHRQDVLNHLCSRYGEHDKLQTLVSCYFDTPARDLEARKIALRVRRTESGYVQTLKTQGEVLAGGVTRRGEWEWPVNSLAPDTQLLKEHLPSTLDLSPLEPVFTTEFVRLEWSVAFDNSTVLIVLDEGEVRAGQSSSPISELELELQEGSPEDLSLLAFDLAEQTPVYVGIWSKAERAQRLLNPESIDEDHDVVLEPSNSSAEKSAPADFAAYLIAWERSLQSWLEEGQHSYAYQRAIDALLKVEQELYLRRGLTEASEQLQIQLAKIRGVFRDSNTALDPVRFLETHQPALLSLRIAQLL